MRAKTEIEGCEEGRPLLDRHRRRFPYQVNKARLIERIADLVREKTLEGISDLRDESDRDGMRIVIELKRGEVSRRRASTTSTSTRQLQTSFGIIMLAIVGGRPKVLTLARAGRAASSSSGARSSAAAPSSSCARPRRAAHILEGLKIALDHLDAVDRA